jgi:hypothetical protein
VSINYEFYAVSGDCSANGMSDVAETLPIPDKCLRLAFAFLKAQTTLQEASAFWQADISKDQKADDLIFKASIRSLQEYYELLKEAGVFKHKWHLRTSWIIREVATT